MKRPLFRKRDCNNDSVALSGPSASAATSSPHSCSQPSSLQVISSDVEQQSGSDIDQDTGDDTAEEDNAELEQYYLTNPDSVEKDVGTIFGKGIGVWKSYGGTVNTYIVGDTIDGEVMMPRKRKRTQRFTASFLEQADSHASYQRSEADSDFVLAPDSFTLPNRPAAVPAPITALRSRDPTQVSTIFHHGSAAINPLGAYTRPFAHIRQRPQAQQPQAQPSASDSQLTSPSGPVLPPEKRYRVVSGSFGTFEGLPGRFDERPYRLLPGRKDEKNEEARPMYKARPWLRK
ncbi:hypothetical protein E8E11_011077 [Didymella keratinophila]|nr:hypothetical protein E8E11_011077 [Didymella keratinophila]